jgi:putative ABC transport system permease protein
MNDLKFAVRQLRKNLGFTTVAVLTLALGIGANTAIFSFANAILLRPLPYNDADRLVMIFENYPAHGWFNNAVAAPLLEAWRKKATAFEGLGARAYSTSSLVLTGLGSPETLRGMRVSANVFGLLGVKPVVGRGFQAEDEVFGKHQVALLSYEFWQNRFGGDTNVIGRMVVLNSEPRVVIGVMPPRTDFPSGGIQVWLPLAFEPWELQYRHAHNYLVLAKLRPGISLAQANVEMRLVAEQMAAADPENKGWGVEVHGLQTVMVGDIQRPLLVLVGAVGLVLLIGCANLANLLLIRSTARVREFAIRSALGAERGRLIRQLLTENLLLSALGGLGGWLLATAALAGCIRLSPPNLPRLWEGIHLDGTALAFTAFLSLLTGLLFGLLPALQASNPALAREFTEKTGGSASGRRDQWRRGLVIAEMALSVVLLIGAGLMIRSFSRLFAQDFGFNPAHLVIMDLNLPSKKYPTQSDRQRLFDELLTKVHAAPGVIASAAVFGLPLSGSIEGQDLELVGGPPPNPAELLTADYAQVSPGYFSAMNIPLLEGRDFTERDTTNTPMVLIVNESLIRQFKLGTNVLGRRLKVTDSDRESEIIGVVKDVKGRDLASTPRGGLYRSYKQVCRGQMTLVIRTLSRPSDLARTLRAELDQLDKDLPIENVRTMTQVLALSIGERNLSVRLLTGFAGAALVLAAIGIYGVLAYHVTQRTREIGIRMALGAPAQAVLSLVLWQGMSLALIGVGIGVALALALTRAMQRLLFEVEPTDPFTFAGGATLLLGVALLACWLPARRASKVDPMEALRHE